MAPTAKNVTLNAVGSVAGWDGKWRSNDLAGQQSPILFETDFSQDAGYSHAGAGGSVWNQANVPTGFTGVRCKGTATTVETLAGEGVGGSNAMRIKYDIVDSQPNANLGVHLTNDQSTGYNELYVRMRVRLPSSFQMDAAGVNTYWKWLRLWQNTSPTDQGNEFYGWSENRVNSGYVVSNFSGPNGSVFGTDLGAIFAGRSSEPQNPNLVLGSAGGYYGKIGFYQGRPPNDDYSNSPGFFERIWPIDWTAGANQGKQITPDSTWHTIEYRVKLASSDTAQDGIFQVWFDGVLQEPQSAVITENNNGYPDMTGLATPVVDNCGFNFVSFFDNTDWFKNSATSTDETGIFINDVVVSGQRIGHDYVVGS